MKSLMRLLKKLLKPIAQEIEYTKQMKKKLLSQK